MGACSGDVLLRVDSFLFFFFKLWLQFALIKSCSCVTGTTKVPAGQCVIKAEKVLFKRVRLDVNDSLMCVFLLYRLHRLVLHTVDSAVVKMLLKEFTAIKTAELAFLELVAVHLKL